MQIIELPSGEQVKAARNLLRMTQVELATAAKVTPLTLSKVEGGSVTSQIPTRLRVKATLEQRGIRFTSTGVELANG